VNGTHLIENSTLLGNTVTSATGSNGEIGGGAILSTSNGPIDITLANSTVAFNTAPAGGEQLFCSSCDNENGFFRLRNSIIAGSGGAVPACEVRFSTVAYLSEGGNVSTDSSCDLTEPTDRNDVADVMLGLLGDNGGVTETMALMAGSPAIGAAVSENCPLGDQRGFERGATCDVGAYERDVVPPPDAVMACPPDEAGILTQLEYIVETILPSIDTGAVVVCLEAVAGTL